MASIGSAYPASPAYTNTLNAGDTITVSPPTGASALFERRRTGGAILKEVVAGGTPVVFGPYRQTQQVSVSAFVAECPVIVVRDGDMTSAPVGIPITISGMAGAGNVLTAALPPGCTATGYQWYRQSVAIAGATSQTYTQTAADVTGRSISVSAAGITGYGTTTAQSVGFRIP